MDVNAIDLTGLAGDADALAHGSLEEAAAENLKRVRRAPAAEPDWTRRPRPGADDGVPRDQDRLAPDRRLTVACPRRRPRRPLRGREVPARRTARAAGAAARRLLQVGVRPALPLITEGANAGLVDWDHPDSWLLDDALAAIRTLCRDGRAHVPVYDIARDGRCGEQLLDLGGHRVFVAEGIFAQEVVPACEREGLLEAAYCVTQHPLVTFWRRLTRDLREHRKPPLVLVRRGWSLMRAQREVVRHAVALGCRPVAPTRRTPRSASASRPAVADFPAGLAAAGPAVLRRGLPGGRPGAARRRPTARRCPTPRASAPRCWRCTPASRPRSTSRAGSSRPGRARSAPRRGPWPASSSGTTRDLLPRRSRCGGVTAAPPTTSWSASRAGRALRRQRVAAPPRGAGPRGRPTTRLRVYEPASRARSSSVGRERFVDHRPRPGRVGRPVGVGGAAGRLTQRAPRRGVARA